MASPEHPDPSVDEYMVIVRGFLAPLRTWTAEKVALSAALGRITAAAVLSPVDLPLFRNSQMDGFAVHTSDLADLPATLPIVGEIAARPGDVPALVTGTAVRIMTGAVVPEGADAVVPVEDTDSDRSVVTIRRGRATGDFVRERGSDLSAGDELLGPGLRLGSRHLAALGAAGLDRVDVRRRILVAVITTGAELVAPGETVSIGQVYDANAVALMAAITAAGAVVSVHRRVTDDHGGMLAALRDAAGQSDLIVTSGGISMGEYEVVREVLIPLGGTVGHIAMQPGGPQATAVVDGVPVVSFPGNPVSTQISFEIFLAPILRDAALLSPAVRRSRTVTSDIRSVGGKRQFLRGRARDGDRVEIVGGPSSHLVAALAASDLLVDIPASTTELKAGDTVETLEL